MPDTFIYDVEPPAEAKQLQLRKGFDLLGRMAFQEGWSLDRVEDEIRFAYAYGAVKYHGNIKKAAEAIGIHRLTLGRILKQKA